MASQEAVRVSYRLVADSVLHINFCTSCSERLTVLGVLLGSSYGICMN